jgi:predicted RNase H-like HicB family nuclease
MKYHYLIVIEKGPTSYGAYAPDVPGCGTSGDTPEEALANIQEALQLYLETALERGEQVPSPNHIAAQFVDITIPDTPDAQQGGTATSATTTTAPLQP